jgi:hypothetical protein
MSDFNVKKTCQVNFFESQSSFNLKHFLKSPKKVSILASSPTNKKNLLMFKKEVKNCY